MTQNDTKLIKMSVSLPALERLLGGDSQLEIDLRQQIAEQFAKKHVKALINAEALKSVTSTLSSAVTQTVKDQVGTVVYDYNKSVYTMRLTKQMEEAVSGIIKNIVNTSLLNLQSKIMLEIQQKVEAMAESWKKRAEDLLTDKINKELDRLVHNEVGKRVDDAIRETIVQRLNTLLGSP
jgi:hypothetical protein